MKYQTMWPSSQLYLPAKACLAQGGIQSNIKREALDILHGLKKFHHYCFVREVHVITDHKMLVTLVSKDVAKLSHWM